MSAGAIGIKIFKTYKTTILNRQKPASKIHGLPKIKPRKMWAVFLFIFAIFSASFFFNIIHAEATPIHEDANGNPSYITVGNKNYDVRYDAGMDAYFVKENGLRVDGQGYKTWATEQLKTQQIGTGPAATAKAVWKGDPDGPGWFEAGLSWIVTMILGAIRYLAATFLVIAAYFLNAMLSPNLYSNFASEPIITTGWVAVRDICNLFFLLVLLFIAFCTILQIEKYHAKKTLLTFILMALLVNFSKPIAIFIFDGSQLLMNFFLAKMSSASGAMSFSERLISNAKVITAVESLLKDEPSSYQLIAKYMFAIIFYFMAGVAFFVLAANLMIRIIVLWMLIILSPFAFLFSAIPDFKKISNDWWDAIFKYSYVGPSIAFFLWLATYLTQSSLQTSLNSINFGQDDRLATWAAQQFIPFLVILVFLYAAIIMSQKFSIHLSSAITSRANKALSFFPRKGWQGTKYAAKGAGRWMDRKFLMAKKEGDRNWSPRAWWKGWKERAAEVDQKALDVASGFARDSIHRRMDGKETQYGRLAIDRNIAKKMKEISESSEESGILGNRIINLAGKQNEEAQEELSAIFRILWKNKDQNDILEFIRDQISDPSKRGYSHFRSLGFDSNNTTVSQENANDAIERILTAAGASDAYILKEWMDTGVIAAGNGGIGFGRAFADPNTGKLMRAQIQGQEAYNAIAKILTTDEAQGLPKKFHKNHFTDQRGNLNESGKVALRMYVNNAAIKHSDRHKYDFYNQVSKDANVSDQMYAYAAQLGQGTAMGYNNVSKQYEQLKRNENQAKQAAAWIVATQRKAGVSTSDISNSLASHGFNETEISDIITNAKK